MALLKHSNKWLEHDRSLLQRSILRKNRLQSTRGDHRFQSKKSCQKQNSLVGNTSEKPQNP